MFWVILTFKAYFQKTFASIEKFSKKNLRNKWMTPKRGRRKKNSDRSTISRKQGRDYSSDKENLNTQNSFEIHLKIL